MQKISIKKPSTLRINIKGNRTKILDKNKREIYNRVFKNDVNNFEVNLPRAGEYFLEDNCTINEIFDLIKKEPNFELPTPERQRYKPFKIVKNKHLKNTPARIYTNMGIIETGSKFQTYPPQTRLFILLHELGHFFYKTEWKTDLFALYYYQKLGYNSSQAFYSLSRVLNPNSPQNKIRILNLFIHLNKKHERQ